jgi:hypothetical protein
MAIDSTGAVVAAKKTDIPVFAGSEVLSFSVADMPPNTRIYTYVNGVNITAFTGPISATAKLADIITTDQLGFASGYVYIPSTAGKYQFSAGEIRLTFGDSPDGIDKCTYISESTLYNHGLSLVDTEQGGTISLRQTEKFRTDNAGSSGDKNTTQARLDPLTQTFIVDPEKNPLGVVCTGLALFFTKKDDVYPVGVELRPMDGAVPSTTEYFSGTSVFVSPDKVNLYTKEAGAKATQFTFEHPVYLKPGTYAFSVLTKSAKYELFCSGKASAATATSANKLIENLQSDSGSLIVPEYSTNWKSLGSDNVFTSAVVKALGGQASAFTGKLFKAQNTGAWFADLTQDITFYLRKAKFKTGTVVLEMTSPDLATIDYNRLRLLTTEVSLGDTAYVDYKIQTTTENDARTKSDFKTIVGGDIVDLVGRQSAKDKGDIKLQISMTTKSADVAPILDRQLIKSQVLRNAVTEYNADISNSELSASNGTAKARYISKVVTLQQGFDSTGLDVKVNVNRKVGTDIEVFARVLAKNDKAFSAGIAARPWVKMPLFAPTTKSFAGTDDTLFTEENYKLTSPSLAYSNTANVDANIAVTSSYEDFNQYQIKIIMYASNPVYLPKIKNLVATSVL